MLASLHNKNADVLDVINSNWKFDVLLDGMLLSCTTNLNGLVLLPQYEFVESEHRKRENIKLWLPFLTSRTSR